MRFNDSVCIAVRVRNAVYKLRSNFLLELSSRRQSKYDVRCALSLGVHQYIASVACWSPLDLRTVLKYRFSYVSFCEFFSSDASYPFTHNTWRGKPVENCALNPQRCLWPFPLVVRLRVICFNDPWDTKLRILKLSTGLTCNYDHSYTFILYFRTYDGVNRV